MDTYNAIADRLFTELYRDICNIHYYQKLAGQFQHYAEVSNVVNGILIVIGIVLAAWPWAPRIIPKMTRAELAKADETSRKSTMKSLLAAALIGAAGAAIFLLPFSSKAARYDKMVADWVQLRTKVEGLETQLRELKDKKDVPQYLRDETKTAEQEGTKLAGEIKETDNETFKSEAIAETNEFFYGEGIKTKKEAEDDYVRRKQMGLPPARQFTPKPKADPAPAGQSASPAARPAPSVARAQ
jgi:gas vesicle protein